MAARPVSGQQFSLAAGGYTAQIASVGGSLRELRFGGRDLVAPYAADQIRPYAEGAVLAPWPGRIASGRYRLPSGQVEQLPLTEPGRGNAIHGLAMWLDWRPAAVEAASVRLESTIEPRAGYPFRLALWVDYRLTAEGLHWQVGAVNTGSVDDAAPFGAGLHPYLVAGPSPLGDWELRLPASQFLEVTPDRLLPVGVRPVAWTEFDFTQPRRLGKVEIDTTFTGLEPLTDGRCQVELVDRLAGTGTGISWPAAACRWVQVFTADRPGQVGHRGSVAVEPMSCPPDAFNSGTDVVWLRPGEAHGIGWTKIAALEA